MKIAAEAIRRGGVLKDQETPRGRQHLPAHNAEGHMSEGATDSAMPCWDCRKWYRAWRSQSHSLRSRTPKRLKGL